MTLVEVLAAVAILAILSVLMFATVFSSSRRSRVLEREAALQMAAATILELVSEDIKGAFVPRGETPYLVGEDGWHEDRPADRIQLITTATMPVSPDVPNGGLSEVGYWFVYSDLDEKGTLMRREQYPPAQPDDEGGTIVEVTGRLSFLNLRYFDGDTWWDEWDSLDQSRDTMWGRIPAAVEVEIGMVQGDSELTARTRVAPVMAGGLP